MKALLPLLLALAAPVFAQAPATPAPAATPSPTGTNTNRPLFRCTLPGGVYEVAVGAIVAVTSHEYVVDGVARVVEVNIDTAGSLLARFYYIEPNAPAAPGGIGAATIEKAQSLMQEAEFGGRFSRNDLTPSLWSFVWKSSPRVEETQVPRSAQSGSSALRSPALSC